MSRRWISEVVHYSNREKSFHHSFNVAGESFGVTLGSVNGDGSIKDLRFIDNKTISFTLVSKGPNTPSVTVSCLTEARDEQAIKAVKRDIYNAFENAMMKREEGGKRVFRSLAEMEAEVSR